MLTAAILAGGKSSRMGANKALLSFRGHPMISAVADAVRPVASELFVVADDGAPYASLGFETVADIHKGRGPLGGLHAALTASRTDETLLLACDIPLVSTSLLRYLSEFPSQALARVAEIDGHIHPLCAVYSKRCLPEIERLIASGRLAMAALLDAVGAQAVPVTPDLSCYRSNMLANINDLSTLHAEESAG
jgi:molybdopterin-guanine dinucleotide biosynthesis protein A